MRFTLLVTVVLASFLSFSFVYSQDGIDKPKSSEDGNKKQTQTTPAKYYDLMPVFDKDTKWKEEIDFNVIIQYIIGENVSYKIEFKMEIAQSVEFTEFKNNKPSKIKYYNCTGSGEYKREERGSLFSSSSSGYPNVRNQIFHADVADDYSLKISSNKNNYSQENRFLPGTTFFWFQPPLQGVRIGDTWNSTMSPVNKQFYEDNKLIELSGFGGTYTLQNVVEESDEEIAYIVWDGKCKLEAEKQDTSFDVEWKVNIVYDITNKRVISYESVKSSTEDHSKSGIFLDVKKKCIYEGKLEQKIEEEPIKPKSDDDE